MINCNSVRILQRREKELIENIFKINFPIFSVGKKGINISEKQYEWTSLNYEDKEKIEILKNRIFCLDSSNESILL